MDSLSGSSVNVSGPRTGYSSCIVLLQPRTLWTPLSPLLAMAFRLRRDADEFANFMNAYAGMADIVRTNTWHFPMLAGEVDVR